MIEMELNKIIIDEKRQDQVIMLKEKNGVRTLTIVIGLLEASSIKMKLAGIKAPRPLTHDLLYSIIESLKAKVEKIVIDKLENNTFYAKMFIASENQEARIIDARPSDSIALAVRAKAPIFVEEEVLEQSTKYT